MFGGKGEKELRIHTQEEHFVAAKTALDYSHFVDMEQYHTQLPEAEVDMAVGLDMDMDTVVRLEVVVVHTAPHLAEEEEGGSFKLSREHVYVQKTGLS
jgi:hypothetical protein